MESAAQQTADPSVFVVVLNWNNWPDTIECVTSLMSMTYANCTVAVVDNGSTDGSVPRIRGRFPGLQILETRRNLGYAEGNNVGMRLALEQGSDYILLLNNDTIVAPSLVSDLVRAAEACPDGGFFSPTIYYSSDPKRIWFAGVDWLETTMEFRHRSDDPGARVDTRGVVDTDYASGCALLTRSSVLRRIGLLDSKFFLTFEETDLCYRGRRDGLRSYVVARASLWHKVSASFGGAGSPLITYFQTRNKLLWGERHLRGRALYSLYKRTLWELRSRLLSSNAHQTWLGSSNRTSGVVALIVRSWKNPDDRAFMMGAAHYLLRQFGDAPRYVRQLRERSATVEAKS
jgi:GT2 family glycosyltransferase